MSDNFENAAGRTELSSLGEFGFIDWIQQHVELNNSDSVKGIGDDAAVFNTPEGHQNVVSTDMLVEGVHFDLSYVPLKHLGYKAIMVNLSDAYAMNAIPKQVTVSIAISNRFSVEAVEELYQGMLLACKLYNVDLIGGDTTSSLSGLVLSITVLGTQERNKIVYRNGAQDNDLLVVSGDLGGAYMGLQLLEREKQVFKEAPSVQPDLGGHDYILERQLKPEARKDIVELLEQLEVVPTSMIDVSDGLASEAIHIAYQSGKGIRIYEEKIPVDPMTYNTAREFDLDPSMCALNGGEDYELLFTIKQEDFDKIKGNPNLTVIGHITNTDGAYELVANGGSVIELKAQGWDSFLESKKSI